MINTCIEADITILSEVLLLEECRNSDIWFMPSVCVGFFVIDAGKMIVSELLFKECRNSFVVHGIGVYFDMPFCILEHM